MSEPGSGVGEDAGGVPAWTCGQGWLVRRGPAPPAAVEARRASGQPPRSGPGVFWLIDRNGRVARRFEGSEWGIDDELGAVAYVVEDGALIEITTQQGFRGGGAVRESVAVAGLRPVAADDAGAARIIAGAVRREEREQAERAEAAVRAGRQRIAAISGAEERYELGDEFDRAQSLLLRQLAGFDSSEAAAMLRALVRFGAPRRAAPDGWRAPLVWAAEPLVAAALIVANDRSTGELLRRTWTEDDPAPAPGRAEDRPEMPGMMETLDEARRELERRAGWANDTDARNTAISLGQAARAVAASRRRLERLAE